MQKYMTHPKHGKMPVYSEVEIASNKKNGWIMDGESEVKPQTTIHLPKKQGRPTKAK